MATRPSVSHVRTRNMGKQYTFYLFPFLPSYVRVTRVGLPNLASQTTLANPSGMPDGHPVGQAFSMMSTVPMLVMFINFENHPT